MEETIKQKENREANERYFKDEEEHCGECGLSLDECGWSNCGENPEDI